MIAYLIISIVLMSIIVGIFSVLIFEKIMELRANSKILPKKKELKIEKKIITINSKVSKLFKEKDLLEEIKKENKLDE